MATLMDLIMQEYQTMPAGSPDYTLGSRRTMMQPGGQFNDAGRLGNMGMRQTLRAQGDIPQPAPASPGFFPPRAEGDTGLSTPIIQTPNRRPQIPQEVYENFQRVVNPMTRNVPVTAPASAPTLGGNYNDVFNAPYTPVLAGQYNDVFNAPYTPPAAPIPPRIPGGQTRGVREPGFFERLFQGTDFQSNNMPVTMTLPSTAEAPPQYINFGDAANAADFFRADRALMQQNPAMFGLLGGTNG